MPVTFYCTRCGSCLLIDAPSPTGTAVCSNCHCTTRVPTPTSDAIPYARLAWPDQPEDEQASSIPAGLAYASVTTGDRYERLQQRDATAERLQNIVDDTQSGAGEGMTSCSYCGTTIAKFIRKCPSCRHPLWGI